MKCPHCGEPDARIRIRRQALFEYTIDPDTIRNDPDTRLAVSSVLPDASEWGCCSAVITDAELQAQAEAVRPRIRVTRITLQGEYER